MTPTYLRSQGTSSTAVALLQKARNSVSLVGKRQMTNQCRKVYREHRVETWNNKLNQLAVQRKFLAITELYRSPEQSAGMHPNRSANRTTLLSSWAGSDGNYSSQRPRLSWLSSKSHPHRDWGSRAFAPLYQSIRAAASPWCAKVDHHLPSRPDCGKDHCKLTHHLQCQTR